MAYIFKTRRLAVRRFRGEDLAAFRAVMRDADSQRFLSFSSLATSQAAARQLLEETIVAYDSPEPRLAYAVELLTSATFIGLAGISGLGSSEAEIMYAVAPRHRGRGLATELAAGLVSYARDVLDVPVLVAFVVPDNERSKRILRGLGFHGDGPVHHPAFAEPVERFVLDEGADG
jgi:ribosomal-protein-alanine N-acetyltransferase